MREGVRGMGNLLETRGKAGTPKVSVIIPVRNGERTLARAIDSALAQTYSEGVEVIVVDNASADRTAEIIQRYGDRIIALSETEPGPSRVRNVAIAVSRGEYVAFLDADDEWMTEKLACVVPVLDEDPESVLVYHDAIEVDTSGTVIKTSYYPIGHCGAPSLRDLLSDNWPGLPILPTNAVMRRDLVMRIGGFSEQQRALVDVGLWIRAREQGRFHYFPQVLARREWEPSERRESWYIAGAYDLYRLLRPRYGHRMACASLIAMLNSAGTMAMLRGDRALARKRYFESLRMRPVRLKTWIRLCATLLPARLVARGEDMRLRAIYGSSDRRVAAATAVRNG
jgi:glycosyltransferase involved in cell wall biosynthesis